MEYVLGLYLYSGFGFTNKLFTTAAGSAHWKYPKIERKTTVQINKILTIISRGFCGTARTPLPLLLVYRYIQGEHFGHSLSPQILIEKERKRKKGNKGKITSVQN